MPPTTSIDTLNEIENSTHDTDVIEFILKY